MSDHFFDFKLYGMHRVRNSLRRAATQHADELSFTVGEWAFDVVDALAHEPAPPEPPDSAYTRTGQMQRSWTAEMSSTNAAIYHIYNLATDRYGRSYAFRVVGDEVGERQAWMHKGRWFVARRLIDRYIPALRERLVERLTRLIGRG